MPSYRPDPRILELGSDFYDEVAAADFPQCTPRFLNKRAADQVALELGDDQWARHFCRFEPLADNLPTSGLAMISFAIDDWADISFGRGRLERLVSPALLREES